MKPHTPALAALVSCILLLPLLCSGEDLCLLQSIAHKKLARQRRRNAQPQSPNRTAPQPGQPNETSPEAEGATGGAEIDEALANKIADFAANASALADEIKSLAANTSRVVSVANVSTSEGGNATAAAEGGNATAAEVPPENQTSSESSENTTSKVGKNASELAPRQQWASKSTAHKEEGMNWQQVSVLVIVISVLALLTMEIYPPHVVLMGAFVFAWNLNIITTPVAISNFSNPALITMAALFIVVKGVDRSKLIDYLFRLCLGKQSSEPAALLRFCSVVIVAGAFVSSTPLVALLMPILRDWARSRDWAPSKFLMPLSYSSIMGASMSLIGSTTNLMVDGLLTEASGEHFGFFENARVGVLASLCALVYLLTVGRRFLPSHHGGLFRSLKERSDMITELQVPEDFELVGTDIREALDRLGIRRDSLLKVFRKPPRKLLSKRTTPMIQRQMSGDVLIGMSGSVPDDLITKGRPHMPPMRPRTESWQQDKEDKRVRFSDTHEEVEAPRQLTLYEDRIKQYWGPKQSTRRRAASEGQIPDSERMWSVGDPQVREIFPVPDSEVLEGGDVLLLSLPQDKCLAISEAARLSPGRLGGEATPSSGSAAGPAASQASAPAAAPPAGDAIWENSPVRIGRADVLMLPGYHGEYVELVMSYTNPFVGQDLQGDSRRRFEKHYQVGILAVRHATGQDIAHLLLAGGGADTQAGKAAAGQHLVQENVEPDTSQCLRAGDTVLVLAQASAFHDRLNGSRDFLAATRVGVPEEEETVSAYDYVPLVLFVAGLAATASGQVSMLRVSMALAAVCVVGGWVPATEVRECIDWNLLILTGCSLGLAEAVKASGLSSKGAALIMQTGAGKHGTVFLLFLMVMLISETVTTSAAAALGFPLAMDLSEQLGLQSLKPLAMTVMLAASTSYANPVSTPPNLIVMGPGGYSFLDYIKVGIPMDLIYCCICCSLLPSIWPLE